MSEAELKLNFEHFDRERKGFVTLADLRRVYEKYELRVNKQTEAYFHYCDATRDGRLSLEEFRTFMNGDSRLGRQ